MLTRPSGNAQRRQNRALVLRSLMRESLASRADLARLTGLARPTISEVVKGLLDEGVIVESGERHSARPGKPAVMLEFDPDAAQILAVDLSNPAQVVGALVRTDGTIAHRIAGSVDDEGSDARLSSATHLADALLALSSRPLLGVGIGAPLDSWGAEGADLTARIAGAVAEAARMPAQILSDADLAAHAERRFCVDVDTADFLLVRVGACTSTTVVAEDAARASTARELAHVQISADPGPDCRCGLSGCVHGWVAAALGTHPADPVRVTAARHLGIALSVIVTALDLPRVVLSGPVDEAFCTAVGEAMADATRTAHLSSPTVVRPASVEDAVLRGAAARVFADELGIA